MTSARLLIINLVVVLFHLIGTTESLAIRSGSQSFTSRMSMNKLIPATIENEKVKEKKRNMDGLILQTAIPAMMNLAIAPLVSSVETMWIGRMEDALALAGQSAANTAFLTCFYLLSFLPTIAAPTVATLFGAGKHQEAREKISETLSLCNILGLLGMSLLTIKPGLVLRMVLAPDAPSMKYAVSYLRLRALSTIPSLVSATGFAAFRGTLDTKTPLMISSAASLIKLLLDPLFILKSPLNAAGATIATFCSELFASIGNLFMLSKRNLIDMSLITKPPRPEAVVPLLSGGGIMMIRQIVINIITLYSSRYALSIGQDGIAAAAYGIVMQIYTIGFVVHVAMQGAAAALIPAELAKNGERKARSIADRLFFWSIVTGCALGLIQALSLPYLIPLFTPLPDVQNAVRTPALISCIIHVVNGPRFVGEGHMIGLKCFRELTGITFVGMLLLINFLRSGLGKSLEGVMITNLLFCGYQTISLVLYYLFLGKLSGRGANNEPNNVKTE